MSIKSFLVIEKLLSIMAWNNYMIIFIFSVLVTGSYAQNTGCEAGPEVIQRDRLDHGREHSAVMPSHTWTCDGPVVEWQFFTFSARNIKMIAFTKVPNTDTDWEVVGFNDVPVYTGGFGSYKVPENMRIQVTAGNAIGYSGSNVKYSGDGTIANINCFSMMGSSVIDGSIYEMRWPAPEPRTYSIKGIVENPRFSFDLARDKVDEGSTLTVYFTNVGKYNHTVRVTAVDGVAKALVDYVPISRTYTLSGSEKATFQVTAVADNIDETVAKDFKLAIFSGNTQIVGTENFQMTITVSSDIPCPDVWWKNVSPYLTITEGEDPLLVQASRTDTALVKTTEFEIRYISSVDADIQVSPNPKQLSFVADQSTSTQHVSIKATEDCIIEEDETFTLTVYDPTDSDTCTNQNRREPYTLSLTIKDRNQAKYSWNQTTIDVDESAGQVELCLMRTGCTHLVTVDIKCDPAIIESTTFDFMPLRSQIQFQKDNTQGCTNVFIVQDTIPEPTESFSCTILSTDTNVVVTSPNTVTVNIRDDEVVTVGWERTTYLYTEGMPMVYPTILKEGNIDLVLTITATPVTATPTSDFSLSATSITIPAGSTSYTLNELVITDDDIDEPAETFILTISSVSFGNIVTAVADITIIDNDMRAVTPVAMVNVTSNPTNGLDTGAIVAISVATVVAVIVAVVFMIIILNWSNSRNLLRRQQGPNASPIVTENALTAGELVPINPNVGFFVGGRLQTYPGLGVMPQFGKNFDSFGY